MTPGPGLSSDDSQVPVATWRVASRGKEGRLSNGFDLAWQRVLTFGFLVMGVAYLLMVARFSQTGDVLLATHLKALIAIAVPQAILWVIYRRMTNVIENGGGLGALRKRLPNERAVPCGIAVAQGPTITGTDEGFCWIDQDTLYFKGLHTAFHIARHDLPPVALWPQDARPRDVAFGSAMMIPIPGHEETARLHIQMIDPFEDHDVRRRAGAFHRAVREWIQATPEEIGDTLLPPLAVHPSMTRMHLGARQGERVGFTLAGLNLAMLFTTPITRPVYLAQPIVIFLNGIVLLALTVLMVRLGLMERRDTMNRRRIGIHA